MSYRSILETHRKLLSVKNRTALQYLTQTGAPGTYYHTPFKGTYYHTPFKGTYYHTPFKGTYYHTPFKGTYYHTPFKGTSIFCLAHSPSEWHTYTIHVSIVSRLKNPSFTCLLPFIYTD
jgi:hypothetical protein